MNTHLEQRVTRLEDKVDPPPKATTRMEIVDSDGTVFDSYDIQAVLGQDIIRVITAVPRFSSEESDSS